MTKYIPPIYIWLFVKKKKVYIYLIFRSLTVYLIATAYFVYFIGIKCVIFTQL